MGGGKVEVKLPEEATETPTAQVYMDAIQANMKPEPGMEALLIVARSKESRDGPLNMSIAFDSAWPVEHYNRLVVEMLVSTLEGVKHVNPQLVEFAERYREKVVKGLTGGGSTVEHQQVQGNWSKDVPPSNDEMTN